MGLQWMTLFFCLKIVLKAKSGGEEMKEKPNGLDLLAILIDLYAEQEGVKITYEAEGVAA